MGFINKYPYTDFHELNADALIEEVHKAAGIAEGMGDRVTTLENDVAPIKAAMPDIASDISDLKHDTGVIDSLITNTINPAIDTLQNEVEAPTTGLLDRVTALENAPTPSGGLTEYLWVDSSTTPFDYDSRVDYSYLASTVPGNNSSGDEAICVKLVDYDNVVYDLESYYIQDSVIQRGMFTFSARVPHDNNGVIDYYTNRVVTVSQASGNATYSESVEMVLPEVSIADAGSFLAVDENGEWGLDAPNVPAVESGTIPYTHANITANAYWYKIGNVVTVTTLFNAEYTGLSGDLFTLPYLPKAGFGVTYRPSDPTAADLRGWVSGSTGVLSISTTTNAPNNYGLTFSYVIA